MDAASKEVPGWHSATSAAKANKISPAVAGNTGRLLASLDAFSSYFVEWYRTKDYAI
jgi:hypothetical protein